MLFLINPNELNSQNSITIHINACDSESNGVVVVVLIVVVLIGAERLDKECVFSLFIHVIFNKSKRIK